MKNALYFTLKALFVPKIFRFLSWLFGHVSKSMMSQPGLQTIALDILPNISRSKGNQAMKSCQLIEYNMRNIFVEKSYTKCAGETIPQTLI